MGGFDYMQDTKWLLERMKARDLAGSVTLKTDGGAEGITGINANFKPATLPTAPTAQIFKENPSIPMAANPSLAPSPSAASPTDKQGQFALLAQILSGAGSGLLDKDNPAMAIGATANTVGKNVAGNLALRKYLAQILGEGGSGGQSNF